MEEDITELGKALSSNSQLFELSDNPIQRALGLRKIHALCARTVTSSAQHLHVVQGLYSEVVIKPDQERQFALMQISINNALKSQNRPGIPLLHLSARLLLDPFPVGSSPNGEEHDDTMISSSMHASLVEEEQHPSRKTNRKKSKRSKKAKTPLLEQHLSQSISERTLQRVDAALTGHLHEHDVPNIIDGTPPKSVGTLDPQEGLEESAGKADVLPPSHPRPICCSIARQLVDRAMECARATEGGEQHITSLCLAYEDLLLRERELHEELQQSLNLRLFIAQTEIERLKEEKSSTESRRLFSLVG
jgi:hypothetical protein